MAKIKEEILYDNQYDKLIVKKTYDDSAEIQRVQDFNKLDMNKFGSDYKFVGSVPMHLIAEWLKEAGVSWDDQFAKAEIIKRKMAELQYSKLNVWKGKY